MTYFLFYEKLQSSSQALLLFFIYKNDGMSKLVGEMHDQLISTNK